MAKVVGSELHLPAFRGALQLRQRHDSGIVDQDMQWTSPLFGELSDGGQIGQVNPSQGDILIPSRFPELSCNRFCCREVANGERYVGSDVGKGPRCFYANTGRSSGNDYALPGEIDALRDICGGGTESETAGDACHDEAATFALIGLWCVPAERTGGHRDGPSQRRPINQCAFVEKG